MTTLRPLLSHSDLLAYHDTVAGVFERTMPPYTAAYNISGHAVRFVSPNRPLLDKLTRAFEHLPPTHDDPALTIGMWSGDPAPPSPIAWYEKHVGAQAARALLNTSFDARGELPPFNSGQSHLSFHTHPSRIHLLDRVRNRAYWWIEDANQVPYYTEASPFHNIFCWWLSSHNRIFVHAAAVGIEDGGVLFIGDNGVGKSTCALACLPSDLRYAGDDYCLVTAEPEPYAYSIYNSVRLRGQADFERFPHLQTFIQNATRLDHEKALLFLQEAYADKLIPSFPLRALLIPRIAGIDRARLSPASPAAALQAIAPSTIAHQPGSAREAFHHLARLVRYVPGYVLEIGSDVASIPDQVQQLLVERADAR